MTALAKGSGNEVQYTTRLASLEDAEILAGIGKKTFFDTFAAANSAANMKAYLDKSFTVDQLRKELKDPRCTFILLYDRKYIAGYAKVKKADSSDTNMRNLEIERIYADKDYQGKKAGNKLMQTCIDTARSQGYNSIWLGVWEHNARAIAFYERWGFKKTGTHPFILGDDEQTDIVMVKKLDEDEITSLQY
jgi:ribosomal protein S18 acetylase RimI-like enzyme